MDAVAMDMHEPFIAATREAVPQADEKIAFDKSQVAQHLGEAVDRVRREEHSALMGNGNSPLAKTKYLWLKSWANHSPDQKLAFASLRTSTLRTTCAWGPQRVRHVPLALQEPRSCRGCVTPLVLGASAAP